MTINVPFKSSIEFLKLLNCTFDDSIEKSYSSKLSFVQDWRGSPFELLNESEPLDLRGQWLNVIAQALPHSSVCSVADFVT